MKNIKKIFAGMLVATAAFGFGRWRGLYSYHLCNWFRFWKKSHNRNWQRRWLFRKGYSYHLYNRWFWSYRWIWFNCFRHLLCKLWNGFYLWEGAYIHFICNNQGSCLLCWRWKMLQRTSCNSGNFNNKCDFCWFCWKCKRNFVIQTFIKWQLEHDSLFRYVCKNFRIYL